MEEKRYVIRYDLDYNECLIDTEDKEGVGEWQIKMEECQETRANGQNYMHL